MAVVDGLLWTVCLDALCNCSCGIVLLCCLDLVGLAVGGSYFSVCGLF